MVSRFVAPEFSKAMWRKQQQPGPAFSVQGSQRLRLKLDIGADHAAIIWTSPIELLALQPGGGTGIPCGLNSRPFSTANTTARDASERNSTKSSRINFMGIDRLSSNYRAANRL